MIHLINGSCRLAATVQANSSLKAKTPTTQRQSVGEFAYSGGPIRS
jgi:hypothetical protein